MRVMQMGNANGSGVNLFFKIKKLANFMVHLINLGVLVHQVVKSIINELFF